MRQGRLRVDRAQNHVVPSQEAEHLSAIPVQFRPVTGKARHIHAIAAQLFQPARQQRVRLDGTQPVQILPQPVSAIGAQELHFQFVGLGNAGGAIFFHN